MSFDFSTIGKRIKKSREENGFTQEQLAEFLDVSNAYISKIERGKTAINLNMLSEICDCLKITPSYI
jgi:transcriptional regulator with XRE-family HTH domain